MFCCRSCMLDVARACVRVLCRRRRNNAVQTTAYTDRRGSPIVVRIIVVGYCRVCDGVRSFSHTPPCTRRRCPGPNRRRISSLALVSRTIPRAPRNPSLPIRYIWFTHPSTRHPPGIISFIFLRRTHDVSSVVRYSFMFPEAQQADNNNDDRNNRRITDRGRPRGVIPSVPVPSAAGTRDAPSNW